MCTYRCSKGTIILLLAPYVNLNQLEESPTVTINLLNPVILVPKPMHLYLIIKCNILNIFNILNNSNSNILDYIHSYNVQIRSIHQYGNKFIKIF